MKTYKQLVEAISYPKSENTDAFDKNQINKLKALARKHKFSFDIDTPESITMSGRNMEIVTVWSEKYKKDPSKQWFTVTIDQDLDSMPEEPYKGSDFNKLINAIDKAL